MKKALLVFLGIFICLMFFLVTDCFVNSASRASRAATIISCWGDSITLGYAYQATGQDYPRRLQKTLDTAYGSGSYTVINRGVNSYRADEVLVKTLTWLAADNPNIVLLMIGTNDMTHGQTIESTRGEVQGIINLVNGHINPDGSSPRIIVSAIIPSLTYESWLLGLYNDDLASHLGGRVSWFTSNWDDFYDGDTQLAKAWLMADDFHPNSDGYEVMAEPKIGSKRLFLCQKTRLPILLHPPQDLAVEIPGSLTVSAPLLLTPMRTRYPSSLTGEMELSPTGLLL
jgi:lysophospholipase L1-like esterase